MNVLPSSLGQLITLHPYLRFHLLGSPTVSWNNTFLNIPRRLVRALLYRLACESGPVTKGHLHLLFWSDMPESIAGGHRHYTDRSVWIDTFNSGVGDVLIGRAGPIPHLALFVRSGGEMSSKSFIVTKM
jgi:hypothetical protein